MGILKRLRRMRKRPRKEQRKKLLPRLLLQELQVRPSALCPLRTGPCPRWRTGPLSLCQQELPPRPPTGEEPLPRAGTKQVLVLADQYESHKFLVTDLVACEM